MPIMTRMRDSMPYVLFGLLIAFLITIIFEWGMDYLGGGGGRSSDVVGKVNGRKITYKEFSDLLKMFSDNQKAQTGNEPDENQLKQTREQVWQSLITQHLVNEEIERLGITVTDDELRDWARGDNPPQLLSRNFMDSLGQFNRQAYDQAIMDPRNKDILAQVEPDLRRQRLSEKLQSLVLASVRVSEGDVLARFVDQRQQYDVLYALFDANQLVKDDEIQVSDGDLKEYYDENLDQYKVEATRKLKYVQFSETSSATDSSARRTEIEDAASKARSGLDFVQLTGTYTDKTDSGAWFRRGELTPGTDSVVFSAKVGDVVGPRLEADGYHLTKILDQRKSEKDYVRASHILFSFEGEKDTNALKATARDVAVQAKAGKDFSVLAKQFSKDPGSAGRGGDLGWFTKGRMVKEFESAIFKMKVGEVTGPVRTQFGLHIIKLNNKDTREVKVANIILPITPSSQTKNDVFERSRDFAYNARQSEFNKEAQSLDLEVKETQVQEKGGVVPGIGLNEAITRWAFKNKVGSVGEPFTVSNGYVVCTVTEIKNAGVRSLDEVKESIRPLVLRKKKLKKTEELAAALKAKLSPTDSLSKVVQLNPEIKAQRSGQFTLSAGVPGVGRDLNFIGAVSGLSVGQISAPVSGFRGAYLIQLLTKSPFDSTAYAAERDGLRNQLLQEKKSRFLSDWIAKLKENADIEDDRENFFR
jgi:peptidyl-prolyl cis-trans isomerase D